MTPIEPPVSFGERFMIFAKDQTDYIPLPVSIDAEGCVTTLWEPTAEELQLLMVGGRVRLCVHTFDPLLGEPGHCLQPVSLDVMLPEYTVRES